MLNDVMDLIFIIDLNVEMRKYENQIKEEYNQLIRKQKGGKGILRVTTILANTIDDNSLSQCLCIQKDVNTIEGIINHFSYYSLDTRYCDFVLENNYLGNALQTGMRLVEASHIYHEEIDYANPNMLWICEEKGEEANAAKNTLVVVLTNKWYGGIDKKTGEMIQYMHDIRLWNFILFGESNHSNLVSFYPINNELFVPYNMDTELHLMFAYVNECITKIRNNEIPKRK